MTERSSWVGYVAVLFLEAALTALLLLLMPVFPIGHYPIPYILLTLAVAYLFAVGPAILSIFLGWLLFTYFFVPPVGITWPLGSSIDSWAQQVALLLGVIVVGAAMIHAKRSSQRIQRLADEAMKLNESLRSEISERERTGEALRESEERFRTMVDAIPQLAWIAHPDGYIFWYNRRCYEYTGATLEQLEGWGWQSVIDPEILPEVLERWKAAIATGEPLDMEFSIRGADGKFRWFLNRVVPLKDSEGRVLRWFGTNTDISEKRESEENLAAANEELTATNEELQSTTNELYDQIEERKRAEEALRESEERLRLAQAVARIGAFEWNIITGVNTWTPELEAMYGLEAGQFGKTQTSWEQLVYAEDREAAVALVDQTFATGEPVEGEWRVRWPDGSIHWIFGRFQAFKDADGNSVRLIGVNIDITERKQAEVALRESENRLSFALRTSQIGAWDLDLVNHTAYRSLEHDRVFGYESLLPEWTYEMFLEHVLPEDRADVDAKFRHATETQSDWNFECRIRRADGQVHWIWAAGRHVLDEHGQTRRMAGVVQDITEHKQAEEEIRRFNVELEQRVIARTAQLEAANKELEAFSYSVSHDLNAPLRLIDGFSRDLAKNYQDKLDDRGRTDVKWIRESTGKMAQLIEDLLRLSRIGRAETLFQDVDLSAVVQSIAGDLKKQDPRRRVNLTVQPGVVARADENLIRIVLENLMGNAWKFTSKTRDACIEFGINEQKGERVYFVRDNGAGFDMTYADRLFTPFERLHTEDEFPGTGIGLAIVRRTINRHAGRVWAEGEVGKGASIYFTLNAEGS